MIKAALLLLFFCLFLYDGQAQVRKDSLNYKKTQPIAQQLKEVNITTAKPILERKVDRIVFNAENSIAAIGADALELLATIPGVKVSNAKISLVGKGSVNVLVNDRLVQLTEADLYTYLKAIPADQIARIEIISNPPAKYDAQGNNGLINIVLRKNKNDGLLATVNLDNSLASHYTVATGISLNYHKDKLSLFGNFNFRKGSIAPSEQTDIQYPNQTWKTLNNFRNSRTVPSGQTGIDYQLHKNTLIGASYHAGHTQLHSDETIKTSIFNSIAALDSLLVSDANAKISSRFSSANLFYKKSLDTNGKQVLVNGDWFSYQDDSERYFNNNTYLSDGALAARSFAQYLSASAQKMSIYTLKADVDLPYKTFKLSFGGKLSLINNQSVIGFYKESAGVYQPDDNQTNQFDYTENTQAVYTTFNQTIKKWSFQLGLRAEYTQTHALSAAEAKKNDYLQVFPTAFATYQLDKKQLFSLSYGRRINRPNYKKLNPFRWYSNPYAYMEGNPFLKPSYNTNLELSHTYASLLSTTLSYSHSTDGYNDVNFTDQSSSLQVLRPVNFIKSSTYQYSNSLALSPFRCWQSNNQFNLFYITAQSSLPQTTNLLKGTGAYLATSNQLFLNATKTLAADISFWYQFSGINDIQKLEQQYNLNVGFKVIVLAKRLQIALNQTDLLKTNRYRYSTTVNNTQQFYDNYYDSRQLKLSIRYSFGNNLIKSVNRKTGNDEERKRSN